MPIVPVPRSPIQTHLGKRQVPEIDGSQGGFIGLVVALSVLIVVCCAAVFYLLRHHEPTGQDRAIRRERYPLTREERANSNSNSTMSPSSLFPDLNGLKDKFKRLWNNSHDDESGSGGGGSGRRGGRGWIRAGSGDEWESDSDRGDTPQVGKRAIVGGREGQLKSLSTRPGVEDNVRVVESPLSDTDTGSGFIPAHYTDPFSKESPRVSPLRVDLGRSQSPLSSSSPREATSTDDESHDAHPPDHRHRSTLSNPSVWTPTGSKFVEDI